MPYHMVRLALGIVRTIVVRMLSMVATLLPMLVVSNEKKGAQNSGGDRQGGKESMRLNPPTLL